MSIVIDHTPTWESGPSYNPEAGDPNKPMAADVINLYNDRLALAAELAAIRTALDQMEADLKSPDKEKVFQAMMIALNQVFPAIEQYKGDNVKQLADNENIASDIRGFITSAQSAFNDTTVKNNTNNADWIRGNKIYQSLEPLYDSTTNVEVAMKVSFTAPGISGETQESWLDLLMDKRLWGDNTPLDQTNCDYLKESIGSIQGQFVKDGKSFWTAGSAGDIGAAVAWWYQTSTQPGPKGEAPVPSAQLKAVQGALQQSTQSVSTQATSLQTQEQYYTQEFNQLIGIDNSIKQNEATQVTTLVKNQKSN